MLLTKCHFEIFDLQGYYKVTQYSGAEKEGLLKADGVEYVRQQFRNSYKEERKTFYLQTWKTNGPGINHTLDEYNSSIEQAMFDGRYKLIAIAFGIDKSPGKKNRAFFLIPTGPKSPRLKQHESVEEPVIYRVLSNFKNTEEDLGALGKEFDRWYQK